MRVLYVNHNVIGSGTYNRAFDLAREMARRGHEVTLVTTSVRARVHTRWQHSDGVRVLESPDLFWGRGRTGWDPYNVLRRIAAVSGSAFDLVHAFDSRPAVIFPALAAARHNTPLFMDWADWWGRGGTITERSGRFVRGFFGPIETWFEEAFRTRAVGATVISSALAARCRALGLAPEKVLHLPNGCRAPDEHGVSRAQARSRLGLGADPLLVHLGTTHPGDALLMFDALRTALTHEPRVRLALVGRFHTPLPRDLIERGAVFATGTLSADLVRLWLASADACLVTLRDTIASRGRWPSKVNDYFTAGRATVVTDVGDVAGYIRRAEAGVVCDPNPRAVAASLLAILHDAGRRTTAENNALGLAATTLSWRAVAEQLNSFYTKILQRRAQPLAVTG